MSNTSSILIASTARHRYAFSRGDVMSIRIAAADSGLAGLDERGQPFISVELGPMLIADDHSSLPRLRALVVPMRRRSIALLVDQIDQAPADARVLPLPDLLRTRLTQPWATGVVVYQDALVVQIDLRAIVRSVLASPSRLS
ncbi:MAG TPA: hypothetical protein VFS21_03810 [Roseiflexaceae bacterium]|nr:hypothetical protein [Roseiflexaceae bacterium]